MTDVNHTIRIFPKAFVAFQKTSADNTTCPLGYMTHYEDNAAGRKRQDQMTGWAHGRWSSTGGDMNNVIMENIPMIGFRISRSQRRLGWHNNDAVIRIEDPRGFEVDISVPNMIMLTDNNLLENGEILRECVWGRDGGQNVLLPVNSAPYVAAQANTERYAASVNSRSVSPGDTVLLKNGAQGRYMGSMYPWKIVQSQSAYKQPYTLTLEQGSKKFHIMELSNTNGYNLFKGYASLGASSIVKSEPMTPEQVNLHMAEAVANQTTFDIPKCYSVKVLTTSPGVLKSIDLVSLDLVELRQLYNSNDTRIRAYESVFYGTHKITGKMYRFPIANLGTGQRYLNNIGYNNGTEFMGEEMSIDYLTLTIAKDSSTFNEDEFDYFKMKFTFELTKNGQTLSVMM